MNCPECQELLQQRLDGESLADVPGLEQHLASCPFCRLQHQAAPVLLDAMRDLQRPTPNVDLGRRIVAGVLADRRARWRWRVLTGAALAASILLMALAGYFGLFGRITNQEDPNKSAGPIPPEIPAPADAPSLRQSAEEARLAVTSLTERLADKSKEQARLLLSVAPLDVGPMALPGVKELEQPLDPAARSLRQTGKGVSEGLQTVAQSAGRAVTYFFRELPPLESGAKN